MRLARFVTTTRHDADRRFCPTRDPAAAALLNETPTQMAARLTKATAAASLAAEGRIAAAARRAASDSDVDIRRALDAALRAVEPGYVGIDEVYPDDGVVIYRTMPEERLIVYARGYAIESGVVTLKDDRKEVQPRIEYEAVTAAADGRRLHMETNWDIRVPPNGWAIALEKRRAEQRARPASVLTTDRKGEDVYRNPPNGWQIALAKRRAEGR